MAHPVVLPKLGFDVIEATVVRWLIGIGDPVAQGQAIAEVETDKAIVELEAPVDGTMLAISAAEGALVPVDAVLAFIGAPGEVFHTQGAEHAPEPQTHPVISRQVSPVAMRLATEHGIDAARLTGTGPQGRITKQDVLNAIGDAPPPAHGLRAGYPPRTPNADGKIVLGPMGEAIARRTEATMREVPHFYVNVVIDMTAALALRREINQAPASSTRVSVNDMLIKAAALTLLKYPVFNSTFEGDHLKVSPRVNIGIAVALPQGLVVPAVLDCDQKSLQQIAHDARDLAERAKDGTLRQAEYSGTFSISNLGLYGVDSFTAVIVAPQVGVLSVSAVKPAPVVISNEVVVRQVMTATLGIDHRAAHGAEGAQFLAEFKHLLETPATLNE
jgi:pyruvate dehydrogenase E2 component (dihydrolipoamide acetyltransferase)